MHRWVVLVALAAGIAACGGARQPVTTTVVQTVTRPPSTTSSSTTTTSTTTQPPPPQSYGPYSAPEYTLEVPAGWTTVEDQTKTSGYVESKWRDPASPKTSILVDSQPSPGLSAEEDATSVRAQTSSTPGYQGISFEPASIAGNDGWKWVFEISGTERVDYFLNVCGTSFAILGSTTPQRFDLLAGAFEHVANSVQPSCLTSSTTTSVPTTPPFSCSTESGVTQENDCPPADPANPPANFCSMHQCIDNFDNGHGTAVQCNDGEWSMSGGIQGACSYHGGESSNPPGPPPNY